MGVKVSTKRPELEGLHCVIRAANLLSGERNAPELPIPFSAIEGYARRYNMSPMFAQMVRAYDLKVMSIGLDKLKRKSR